jgi:hypothetical protein
MEHKANAQKTNSLLRNKKVLYPLTAIIILLVIIFGFWFFRHESQLAAEKSAALQKQKAAQALIEKKRNSPVGRLTFFLTAPVGARGGMNYNTYWLGALRQSETDKKMTISYIKNPNYPNGVPLMYIRYDSKTDFKLAAGETELKSNSAKYSFAYYFYPTDSYPGADKDSFTSMQSDFRDALASFSAF